MTDEMQRELARGLAERRAYGKYRGFVTANEDPQQLGRVKLRVPALLGEAETDWALPCLPCGGLANQGLFCVPAVGAQVWVEFEGGNPDFPIWTGTFWQQSGDPPEEAQRSSPSAKVWRTAKGHVLLFEDADGNEQVKLLHVDGSTLDLDPSGGVTVEDKAGSKLHLDVDNGQVVLEDASGNTLTLNNQGATLEDLAGNKVELTGGSVKVTASANMEVNAPLVTLGGAGGEPVIKGSSFLTLFATHVHPTSTGPSGPPIPQGEAGTLSGKVLTS
jgi:uncharacterized protein involved in type VI secretion and phage assembly